MSTLELLSPAEAPAAQPAPFVTMRWVGGSEGYLEILDQRHLPTEVRMARITTPEELWQAIHDMAIRGAPAVGIAGAYGMVLAARRISPARQSAVVIAELIAAAEYVRSSRPTAIHIEHTLSQMLRVAVAERGIGVRSLIERLLAEAHDLYDSTVEACRTIGLNGVSLLSPGMRILTHCNAGRLGSPGDGTALAIVYEAHRRGIPISVFACETRPGLQGSRLTAWELTQAGIPVTVLCDAMAGALMRQGDIDLVLVGADRIAANGDIANRIGSYTLAALAGIHKIPFVVAAHASAFDLATSCGASIPVEQRNPAELTHPMGHRAVPPGVYVCTAAFDITPATLVQTIVTDRGLIAPPNEHTIRHCLQPV